MRQATGFTVHGLAELARHGSYPYVGDSDAPFDGIEEFLTGIRPVPSRIELWQQSFHRCRRFYEAGSIGKMG